MKRAKDIKKLVKTLHYKTSAKTHKRTLRDIVEAQQISKENKLSSAQPNFWRTIMKSRMTKLAAAAVIIGVIVGVLHLGGSIEGASVAWADVLENVCKSKTLTLQVRAKEEGLPVSRLMVVDPYLMRIELLSGQTFAGVRPHTQTLDGSILIVDTRIGKALMLNAEKKIATVFSAEKQMLDVYDRYRNFSDWPGFSVRDIGERQIDGKRAIGFHLKKKDESHRIDVWVDSETQLPIRIEHTLQNAQGQIQHAVITDIDFDAELDKSLFSLRPPQGYELKKVDYEPLNRLKSAVNMDRIIKACRKYVNEHDGQWPDSLDELAIYGLDKDVFTNPRQATREVGYIYLKPPTSPSEASVVLHEAYDVWDRGINVGFANYHIEFIKEESDFKNRLKKSFQRK